MSLQVLIHHLNPIGACYLARYGDSFLAGRSPEAAKPYATAQAVFDTFKPWADSGEHWAWNICYAIEDYVD